MRPDLPVIPKQRSPQKLVGLSITKSKVTSPPASGGPPSTSRTRADGKETPFELAGVLAADRSSTDSR